MKCLTVAQPWAWGIIFGPKRIENRTWPTDYRGPLLIHAGKSRKWLGSENGRLSGLPLYDDLVYGAIIGVVMLDDCVRVKAAPSTPFTEGPWCWLLGEVQAFAEPIPYRGQQNLFDVPDDLLREHAAVAPFLPGW